MLDFKWSQPTQIIMGIGCIKTNSAVFGQFGKTALIVASRSALINGAADDIKSSLVSEGIRYYECYDAIPNSPAGSVESIASRFTDSGIEYIVAVGGGSAMDTAKAVSMLLTNPGLDCNDLVQRKYSKDALPILAVPTTCGTGSEVTAVSVLGFTEDKISFSHYSVIPKVAFLDSSYIRSLPNRILVDTLIDAFSHAAEGYIMYDHPMADMFSERAFDILKRIRPLINEGQKDEFFYDNILLHSTIAGLALKITGTSSVHALGYQLTVHKDYSHGRACGVLLGKYIDMCYDARKEKIDRLLVFAGFDTVRELRNWIKSVLLSNDTFSLDEISAYAEYCVNKVAKKHDPIKLDKNGIIDLIQESVNY